MEKPSLMFPNDFIVYENEDDSDGLQIDMRSSKAIKGNAKRCRKRKRKYTSESSETELEKSLDIERQLNTTAEKNNLTVQNVKNILKRVVTNEHVMAIVRIQEEEEEKQEKLQFGPKLTRAKAKELLQKTPAAVSWPLPITTIRSSSPSEVASLIQDELPEDSSDEEYQPQEEEHSEDENNLSVSDADSQPRTPNVAPTRSLEPETQWTDDGLFKIPQANDGTDITTQIPNSTSSQSQNEDNNIALRTRSKLSLSSTNIETIEKAFVPPDITTDMYDCGKEIDGVWRDFLNEFTLPLTQTHEEDDEADPEYNAQVEDVPVDHEELRFDPDVTISRKELSELVSELFDIDGMFESGDDENGLSQEQQNVIFATDFNELTSGTGMVIDHNVIVEEIDRADVSEDSIDEFQQYNGTDITITPSQMHILKDQMRQHVQLLCQHFLQTYYHPELWHHAPKCKEYLITLKEMAQNNSNSAFMPCNLVEALDLCNNWESRLSIDNEDNQQMMTFVQNEINISKQAMRSNARYLPKFPPQLMDYVCDSRVFIYPMMLPEIAFRTNFKENIKKCFVKGEDELVAKGLSMFTDYMADNPKLYKYHKRCGFKTLQLSELISKYLTVTKSPISVHNRIGTLRLKKARNNPIKYFYKHKKAPPTKHYLWSFDPKLVTLLRDQPKELLPTIWRDHIYNPNHIKVHQDGSDVSKPLLLLDSGIHINKKNSLNDVTSLGSQNQLNTICSGEVIHTVTINNIFNPIIQTPVKQGQISSAPNSASLPVVQTWPWHIITPIKSESYEIITHNPNIHNSTIKSSSPPRSFVAKDDISNSVDTSVHKLESNSQAKNEHECSYKHRNNVNCRCLCICYKENKQQLKGQKLLTEYFKPTVSPKKDKLLINALKHHPDYDVIVKLSMLKYALVGKEFSKLEKYMIDYSNSDIKKVVIFLLSFNIFFGIYFPEIMLPSMPSITTPIKLEDSSKLAKANITSHSLRESLDYPSTSKHCENVDCAPEVTHDVRNDETIEVIDEPDEETEDTKKVKGRNPRPGVTERRKNKLQRELQTSKELLKPHNDECKDIQYAFAYYDKVMDRLNSEQDFRHFISILTSYDTTKDDPSVLYTRLESVFGLNHTDLLDEFLSFLLPGQAAKIGKFMQHFLVSNMDTFIQKLHICFSKQPAQLRKIFGCLGELSEMSNITMDNIKNAVLPLLKGNQLLIEWFLQLFPSERPPESDPIDFEVLDIEKSDSEDVFEHYTFPEVEDPYGGDSCICKCHDTSDEKYKSRFRHCIPCGMKYIQGRVYVQTGKGLRPARITFEGAAPMSEHIKRLSAQPKPLKRRADVPLSPTKGSMSPNKGSIVTEHDEIRGEGGEKSPKKQSKTSKNSPCTSKRKRRLSASQLSPNAPPNKVKCDRKNVRVNLQRLSSAESKIPTLFKRDHDSNVLKPSSVVEKCEVVAAEPVPSNEELNLIIPNDDLNVSFDTGGDLSPCSGLSDKGSDHSGNSSPLGSPNNETATGSKTSHSKSGKVIMKPNKKISKVKHKNVKDNVEEKTEINCENVPQSGDFNKSKTAKSVNPSDEVIWTREEDKIILELYQELSYTDSTISNICNLLPHRTIDQVKSRLEIVMNLLKQISSIENK